MSEPGMAVKKLDIDLDRDQFMRTLIRELSGTLEQVVGLEDASGFISVVGATVGGSLDNAYRNALQVEKLSRNEVANVLVDLKRRIEGQFFVIDENEDRITLGNKACPFGDKVLGRPSMCMMTSNVFGSIAAQNLGYAKVDLERTIAEGHGECRVVIYLKPNDVSCGTIGREYFQAPS